MKNAVCEKKNAIYVFLDYLFFHVIKIVDHLTKKMYSALTSNFHKVFGYNSSLNLPFPVNSLEHFNLSEFYKNLKETTTFN